MEVLTAQRRTQTKQNTINAALPQQTTDVMSQSVSAAAKYFGTYSVFGRVVEMLLSAGKIH